MIKAIFIIVYIYGLLPILIGLSMALFKKSRYSFPEIYVSGYVVYLALFEIIVAWMVHRHFSYSDLVQHWRLSLNIITIIVLFCILTSLFVVFHRNGFTLKDVHYLSYESYTGHANQAARHTLIMIILTLIIIVISILFLVPQAFDETPELARLSLLNNTFFSVDPATGTMYSNKAYPGCIHLFYSFGSTITGFDVTTLIHLIMPVFLIPFFICSYIVIARVLFTNKEQKNIWFRFVCLIVFFYLLMLPLKAHIALAPFRNIWNGITFSASCLIPLLIVACFNLIRQVIGTKQLSIPTVLISASKLVFISISTQLCVSYGFVLCSLFILASIIIIVPCLIRSKRSSTSIASQSEGGVHS